MYDLQFEQNAAILTLSFAPVNALSPEFISGVQEALDRLEGREDISVLHIRSGLRAFSAGGDLNEVSRYFSDPDSMVGYVRRLHELFDRIEALPFVTLAEIGGAALGGGYEFALTCDLRIASESATIGLPEARLGLFPGAGGTQRLTRLCGPGVAARVILSADMLDGAEACRLGLVQWAYPASELAGQGELLRRKIAGLAPPALKVSKQCIAAWSDPATDGFALELECQRPLITSKEARTRISAFLEERMKSQNQRKVKNA